MRVTVTAKDIREGVAGDCFRCAVGLALARHTKDDHSQVVEVDYILRINTQGRYIIAPEEVQTFVRDFDSVVAEGYRQIILKPFSFHIPKWKDSEWDDRCYGCEEFFKTSELDQEGNCVDCRESEVQA